MSAETVDERKHRLLQRIEDGGSLGIDAHEEVIADLLEVLSDELERLANVHLERHKAATDLIAIEWERGMWEAYKHAAGIVSRGEVDEPLADGEHFTATETP